MRPFAHPQSSRVTVLAFNLKALLSFYYSALFVGLMHVSEAPVPYHFMPSMQSKLPFLKCHTVQVSPH